MKKRKIMKIIIPVVILLGIFVVLYSIYEQQDLYKGTSKDNEWKVSIEKSDKTSIGPNYFLNLYWQGSESKEKKITIKQIELIVDGKVYEEGGPYHLSEYNGEQLKDGGKKPNHVSTFDYMPEEDIKGHKLEVKIKWNESKEKTTVFKLEEKKFLNLGF
ncbi:YdhH/YoaO family protein [Bacillus spizizenii]|nr:YdhH/YoaO family protein [Bacillus spizizenii]